MIVLDGQRIAPFLESLIVLIAISQALVRLATNHARTALLVLPDVTAPTDTLQVLGRVVQASGSCFAKLWVIPQESLANGKETMQEVPLPSVLLVKTVACPLVC